MSRRLAFIPLALVALVLISASFLSSSFHSGDRIVAADPSVASAAHSGFAYQTQRVQHAMPPQEGCSLPAAQQQDAQLAVWGARLALLGACGVTLTGAPSRGAPDATAS